MSRKPRRDNLEDYNKGEHIEDLRKFAVSSIKSYFNGKRYFCGGPIPSCEMESEFSQDTVLRTQFDDRCFDFIHECCLPLFPVHSKYKDQTVPWPVHCLLGLISEMKSMDIPKEQQPGMLLLYFKFCWGVNIIPPPLL